jgi:hypothetical protein
LAWQHSPAKCLGEGAGFAFLLKVDVQNSGGAEQGIAHGGGLRTAGRSPSAHRCHDAPKSVVSVSDFDNVQHLFELID